MAGRALSDTLIRLTNAAGQDASIIEREIGDLSSRTAEATRTINSTGGNSGSYSGNVEILPGQGIRLSSPFTGKPTVWLEPDGDAFFGADLEHPALTSLIVFSNSQTYNREAFGFGDVLLGDNSNQIATGPGARSTIGSNIFWDRSTGRLNFRAGTTTHAYIDVDGSLFTELADIGGWNVNATQIYSDANEITLDSAQKRIMLDADVVIDIDGANNKIVVGEADQNPITIDGVARQIRSGNFSSGVSGWQVGGDDSAEFQNIVARGEIRTSVFVKQMISTVAGQFQVTPGGATLALDAVVPDAPTGFFTITFKDPPGGGQMFNTGISPDAGLLRQVTPSGTEQTWVTLVTYVDNGDGTQSYTATYRSGTRPTTYSAGTPFIGYGPWSVGSGFTGGYLVMDADGPYYSVRQWTDNPWTGSPTEVARLGNMNGAFGAGSNDRAGIGVGDYSGGNYMSYNAEVANQFVIKTGDGAVLLDDTGVTLDATVASALSQVKWSKDPGTDPAIVSISGVASTGGAISGISVTPVNSEVGGPDGNLFFSVDGAVNSKVNQIDMYANDDSATGSYIDFKVYDVANVLYLRGDGKVGIGTSSPTQKLHVNGTTLIQEDGTNPGLILNHSGGNLYATIQGPVNRTLRFELRDNGAGDNFEFRNAAGSTLLTVSREGDVYTEGWTDYSATSTITGWSSFTLKKIEYRRIGHLVFVNFGIAGTSDANTVSFTLPYSNTMGTDATFTIRAIDAGGGLPNGPWARLSSNTVVARPSATAIDTGWTASGTKLIQGQFWYEA